MKQEWGYDYDRNMRAANRAIAVYGDDEIRNLINNTSAVMTLLLLKCLLGSVKLSQKIWHKTHKITVLQQHHWMQKKKLHKYMLIRNIHISMRQILNTNRLWQGCCNYMKKHMAFKKKICYSNGTAIAP